MRLPIFNRHPRAELSAHLDGELIPLRVEAMQVHLASCQSCRAELEALRQLKADLAALPEMPAPRSFALTPQMAASPARERPQAYVPPRTAALANGMRLAGAAMSLALALVLVLDFTGSGTSNDDSAATAGSVQELDTAHDSDKSFESNSGPAPAADTSTLRLTPTPTSAPVDTSAAGSVVNAPAAGESPGAVIGGGEAPTPGIVQTDGTTSVAKILGAVTPEPLATGSADALVPVFPASSGAEPTRAADSSGGVDTLLIVALALAAGVVLAVVGSFVLPRIGREEL